MKNRKRIRILINLALAVMVLWAWMRMMFTYENGVLTSRGWGSLQYFTILSNLLEGGASLVLAAFLAGRRQPPRAVMLLKYAGAASVGLTLFTVLVFLGPLYGYPSMFQGVNLWLHLVVPVLALGEFVVLNETQPGGRENLLAVLPMICYGIWYLGNNLLHGVGEWPHVNDFYGFLHWGLPVGIGIFAALAAATWLIGWLLRKGNGKNLSSRKG